MEKLVVFGWGFMIGAFATTFYFDMKVRQLRKKHQGFNYCNRCGCKLWDTEARRKGDCGVH